MPSAILRSADTECLQSVNDKDMSSYRCMQSTVIDADIERKFIPLSDISARVVQSEAVSQTVYQHNT